MTIKSIYLLFSINIFFTCISTDGEYASLISTLQNISQVKPSVHLGIEVCSLNKNNEIIYELNSQHLFIPASNTKLITAALALDTLGSDYQFETSLLTNGFIAKNKLIGNLFFRGSGDPSLTINHIEAMIEALKKSGIKEITGTVCIDTTEFDSEPFSSGIFLDDLEYSWNSPTSAFIVNRKAPNINGVSQLWLTSFSNLPTFDLASLFQDLFEKSSISWNKIVEFKITPKDASVIFIHKSVSLKKLVSDMLKTSDNLYADCLFKKVGSVKHGTPGTWQKGILATKEFLQQKIGINCDEFIIEDGSGKSRYNSLSPAHIVKLLTWVTTQKYFYEFIQSLPIAGIDGTLQNRMQQIKAQIQAKTGTLPGVSALSGYVVNNKQPIGAFSILVNGFVQSKSMAGSLSMKTFKQNGINYKTNIEDTIGVAIVDALIKN